MESAACLSQCLCHRRRLHDLDIHPKPFRSDIHEMGGVRMGNDPKTSLLNKWNQLHACPNVYVTDGACMTSTSTQNPSDLISMRWAASVWATIPKPPC